ncbi:hypothetical protein BLGI_4748 [Brevibacillus laterosporus GI-9]|nr:hypothetical protein BLGI_4748 [Brevibacillus laterosporus GI-9]
MYIFSLIQEQPYARLHGSTGTHVVAATGARFHHTTGKYSFQMSL